ncbi:aminopeptidase [Sporomusa acidovorans]|nr:aminopeptidase [Sporomusa acidovorans]
MIDKVEQLITVSEKFLTDCLGVKPGENFLVVADEIKQELAEAVCLAGKRLGAEAMLIVMGAREKPGQEPPAPVAAAMASAQVVVAITQQSLTHTQARKQAAAAGARIATMPGITRDMFLAGAITADYTQVKELTEKVTALLTKGREVRIEKQGYVLQFSIADRQGIASTGVYTKPGESGNLPSGEAYIAPLEGTANGQILIDGSFAGIGKLASPLLLTVEKGRLTRAEGPDAEALLSKLGDKDGRLLGEFGIGTNDKARITGIILEDEKVCGTIHVAFGSNDTFGGTISAGVHLDGVVTQPNVWLDGKAMMVAGKSVLD